MLEPSHVAWNLFLALIPVLLAVSIAGLNWRFPALRAKWWVWAPLGLLWLGFLPNTCYLLTEWRHFLDLITRDSPFVRSAAHDKNDLVWLIALIAFYVLYTGIGLLSFSMAIWPLDRLVRAGKMLKALFFSACSLGVYLGLIKRLNTWDAWRHPLTVVLAALHTLTNPFLLVLIVAFAGVIWLNYWIFEVFVDGLLARSRRGTQVQPIGY
jgi:uncharacterized membrane protein